MSLINAIRDSFDYLRDSGETIPPTLTLRAIHVGAIKAEGDLVAINRDYHDAITAALIDFFENRSRVTAPRNQFKQSVVQYLGAAFDMGWQDGGGGDYPTGDALDWFNARIELEFGYINTLFQEAKELRKEEGFDFFAWASSRADGYTRTVREMYNAGRTRASKDVMVTFDGEDGAESCEECQQLKGQRHRVSWFVRRNYVPPHGTGLSCHRGRYCQHYLVSDKGERITA